MKTTLVNNLSTRRILIALFMVIGGLVLFAVVLIGLSIGYIAYKSHQDNIKEAQIDKKFHEEVVKVPSLEVKTFMLWEGDSIVELNVKDKGTVRFWYGIDGVPRIDSIGKYSTSYDCFYIDAQGNKKSYAYTTGLLLDKDSTFKQWFPFEVITLKDLDTRYNDITNVLDTFPKNPETVKHNYRLSNRQVVRQSNNKYLVKPDKNKPNIACDLFTTSY